MTRILLAAGALALAVWAGGELRVAILTERGGEERLLRAARSTRATDPEYRLATARLFRGDRAGAAAVAENVVAQEPENGAAWKLLAQALRELDPGRAAAAQARYRELEPVVRADP
jgi:Tfp pilus assembly protein PilF